MSKNINVSHHPKGGWQVKADKAARAIARTTTQREAISIARPIAKKQGAELTIRRPNGQIREKDSHGRDPYPPKG